MNPGSKVKAPMTKEEWEKQQSVIRRVFDADTGRTRLVEILFCIFCPCHMGLVSMVFNRLVRGDGEIIEEIVSRERQKEINKVGSPLNFCANCASSYFRCYLMNLFY